MYKNANTNVEKLLESVNLAVKKLKAIQSLGHIQQGLNSAEKELKSIDDLISKADDSIRANKDDFFVEFVGYRNLVLGDEEYADKLLEEIAPSFTVKDFVHKYVDIMQNDRTALRIDLCLKLNDNYLSLAILDNKSKLPD